MPSINITEFQPIGRDAASDRFQAAQLPAVTTQNVAFTATSAQSATLNSSTGLVRIRADVACAILFGVNPTALVTSTILDAGTEYFTVFVGSGLKIAVIAV